MKLKNLGKLIAIMLLPISLASSIEPFSAPETCDVGYSVEIYAVAMVVWKEARSEPEDGKRMVVQVIRNRAGHYKESILKTTRRGMAWDGELESGIVKLVDEEMKRGVGHNFKHWIQPETATDIKWRRYAMKQSGKRIGRHFFF